MRSAIALFLLLAPPAALARPYDVTHYRIELTLADEGRFENTAKITLTPRRALGSVELDAYQLNVKEVTSDAGGKVTFTYKDLPSSRTGVLTVKPARPFPAGKPVTLSVAYSGEAARTQEGLFILANEEDPLPSYFTQLQPDLARRFFPCNDDPSDKATTELFAVVDGKYQVLSNGKKVLDEAFSKEGKNLRRVHWVQDKPHATYLVAVAIGQFDAVKVAGDLPATIHVPKGKAAQAFIAADATRSLLRLQSSFLGTAYPWAQYDQVAVPRFRYRGMENTSLAFLREPYLVLDHPNEIASRGRQVRVVSHELAHQWLGNLVTCEGWGELWMNEGFATYVGERTADEYLETDAVEVSMAAGYLGDYLRAEAGPRSRPLVNAKRVSTEDAVDAITYTKGAAVLRMLETWIGPAEMKKVLKSYLDAYAFKNASSSDFFSLVGKVTKKERELRPFKDSWLKKRGYPVLEPTASWVGDELTVTIRQRPAHPEEKGPFTFKLPIVLHRETAPSYREERVLLIDKPVNTFTFEVPAAPQWVNWNQGFAALAQVLPSSVGEAQWLAAARADPDPTWRLVAQLALLGELVNPDATGQTKPTDAALTSVLEALRKDPSPYVREAVLDRLGATAFERLPPEFGPVLLGLARRPTDLPEDALGRVRVRRAAMEVLGKTDSDEGRRYLLGEIMKRDLDINYLPALAVGVARLGDSGALASLRAAVNQQRDRGYPYFRAAALALGAATTPEVVPVLRDLFAQEQGNDELARGLISRLHDNGQVTRSTEAVELVRDFAVEAKTFSEDVRQRMLWLLKDVRTPEAKEALARVVDRSDSDRLKTNAQLLLSKNFPAPPAPKQRRSRRK